MDQRKQIAVVSLPRYHCGIVSQVNERRYACDLWPPQGEQIASYLGDSPEHAIARAKHSIEDDVHEKVDCYGCGQSFPAYAVFQLCGDWYCGDCFDSKEGYGNG